MTQSNFLPAAGALTRIAGALTIAGGLSVAASTAGPA